MPSLSPLRCLLILLVPVFLIGCGQQADEAAVVESPAAADDHTTVETSSAETAWWPVDSELPVAIPATRQDPDVVEVFNIPDGQVEVPDPFRWLENDVRVDPEVAQWVEAQNAATFAYLETLPGREQLRQRLTELFDFERHGLPQRAGERYFFVRNDGLQNQSVLFVADALDAEPRVLIDPNEWAEDGTVALAGWAPSPNGELLAFMVQEAGSDWRTLQVMNVDSGEQLGETLDWIKFSGMSWAADSSGLWYSRFPEVAPEERFTAPNLNQTVFFHQVGSTQDDDVLVFADADRPEVGWGAGASDDGRFLFLSSFRGTDGNGLRVRDLRNTDEEAVVLVDDFDHNHSVIGNVDERILLVTDLDAPRLRIVSVDLASPEPENWETLVAEAEFPIASASLIGGRLVVQRMQDAQSVVHLHAEDGSFLSELELPGIGTASGFTGRRDASETFFAFSSFNRPATIFRHVIDSGETTVFREPELRFDPDDFVVEQVFFESTGGARVPMFIAYRRDLPRDGQRSVQLFSYGGFNISMRPSFSVPNLAWMEAGGVYAMANLRGGGEYGRDWHDAGRLKNKQNTFDDLIRAAETLIELGWTEPRRIAIRGGSNGGMVVGAVANQRPDLFGAVIPQVGVMDMLRFTRFTAGRFWVDDYGDPDDPEMFPVIKAYSPLHNLQDGVVYPAILVTTADTDDRVVPGHSFKYAAALQAIDSGPAPALIRIETRSGHGAGTPTRMIIDASADWMAFMARHTGLELE
ncbi:MAG: prolyl oligopeptidase family serine peptidase [Wenzhouxiangella sp.]